MFFQKPAPKQGHPLLCTMVIALAVVGAAGILSTSKSVVMEKIHCMKNLFCKCGQEQKSCTCHTEDDSER